MSIKETTWEYETWLRSVTTIHESELNIKHGKMACGEFEFLRATFYRWAYLFPKHCPELCASPTVLGVGDIHVENYGTWRDMDGRLSWGVNDFDEACYLPYTNDLVRLATSAYFALKDDNNPLFLDFKEACQAIHDGYLKGLDKPKPFILAEKQSWLRNVVIGKLLTKDLAEKTEKDKENPFKKFYQKYTTLDKIQGSIPPDAQKALEACFPEPIPNYQIYYRQAGLGSLGRQRFTAVVHDWQGGIIVREVKALVPSAWSWANSTQNEPAQSERTIYYSAILKQAVRSFDPWLNVMDGWVVRRLGPDAFKVELQDLALKKRNRRTLTKQLLCAMGQEIGNIHVHSDNTLSDVVEHLKKMSNNHHSAKWLFDSAKTMVKQIKHDFQSWQKEEYKCPDDKNIEN